MSPALAGRIFTTESPGKSENVLDFFPIETENSLLSWLVSSDLCEKKSYCSGSPILLQETVCRLAEWMGSPSSETESLVPFNVIEWPWTSHLALLCFPHGLVLKWNYIIHPGVRQCRWKHQLLVTTVISENAALGWVPKGLTLHFPWVKHISPMCGPAQTGDPTGGSWEGWGSLLPLSAPLPPMRWGSKREVEGWPGCVHCMVLLLGKHNSKGNGMTPPQLWFAGGKPAAVRNDLWFYSVRTRLKMKIHHLPRFIIKMPINQERNLFSGGQKPRYWQGWLLLEALRKNCSFPGDSWESLVFFDSQMHLS